MANLTNGVFGIQNIKVFWCYYIFFILKDLDL
jgi:hypothetical protein